MKRYSESTNISALSARLKAWVRNLIAGKTLPPVTSADEGKFCCVNSSGDWVATEVPDANGVDF